MTNRRSHPDAPAALAASAAAIDRFTDAVWLEDGLSANTLAAYRRDLALYARWLDIFPVTTLADAQVFGSLSGSVPAPVLIPIQFGNVAEPASIVLVLSALLFLRKAATSAPIRV